MVFHILKQFQVMWSWLAVVDLTIQPKCTYDLEIEVYGFKFVVPTLVVPEQRDKFIIGSNVIKCVLQKMKSHDKYWELVSCNTVILSVSKSLNF